MNQLTVGSILMELDFGSNFSAEEAEKLAVEIQKDFSSILKEIADAYENEEIWIDSLDFKFILSSDGKLNYHRTKGAILKEIEENRKPFSTSKLYQGVVDGGEQWFLNQSPSGSNFVGEKVPSSTEVLSFGLTQQKVWEKVKTILRCLHTKEPSHLLQTERILKQLIFQNQHLLYPLSEKGKIEFLFFLIHQISLELEKAVEIPFYLVLRDPKITISSPYFNFDHYLKGKFQNFLKRSQRDLVEIISLKPNWGKSFKYPELAVPMQLESGFVELMNNTQLDTEEAVLAKKLVHEFRRKSFLEIRDLIRDETIEVRKEYFQISHVTQWLKSLQLKFEEESLLTFFFTWTFHSKWFNSDFIRQLLNLQDSDGIWSFLERIVQYHGLRYLVCFQKRQFISPQLFADTSVQEIMQEGVRTLMLKGKEQFAKDQKNYSELKGVASEIQRKLEEKGVVEWSTLEREETRGDLPPNEKRLENKQKVSNEPISLNPFSASLPNEIKKFIQGLLGPSISQKPNPPGGSWAAFFKTTWSAISDHYSIRFQPLIGADWVDPEPSNIVWFLDGGKRFSNLLKAPDFHFQPLFPDSILENWNRWIQNKVISAADLLVLSHAVHHFWMQKKVEMELELFSDLVKPAKEFMGPEAFNLPFSVVRDLRSEEHPDFDPIFDVFWDEALQDQSLLNSEIGAIWKEEKKGKWEKSDLALFLDGGDSLKHVFELKLGEVWDSFLWEEGRFSIPKLDNEWRLFLTRNFNVFFETRETTKRLVQNVIREKSWEKGVFGELNRLLLNQSILFFQLDWISDKTQAVLHNWQGLSRVSRFKIHLKSLLEELNVNPKYQSLEFENFVQPFRWKDLSLGWHKLESDLEFSSLNLTMSELMFKAYFSDSFHEFRNCFANILRADLAQLYPIRNSFEALDNPENDLSPYEKSAVVRDWVFLLEKLDWVNRIDGDVLNELEQLNILEFVESIWDSIIVDPDDVENFHHVLDAEIKSGKSLPGVELFVGKEEKKREGQLKILEDWREAITPLGMDGDWVAFYEQGIEKGWSGFLAGTLIILFCEELIKFDQSRISEIKELLKSFLFTGARIGHGQEKMIESWINNFGESQSRGEASAVQEFAMHWSEIYGKQEAIREELQFRRDIFQREREFKVKLLRYLASQLVQDLEFGVANVDWSGLKNTLNKQDDMIGIDWVFEHVFELVFDEMNKGQNILDLEKVIPFLLRSIDSHCAQIQGEKNRVLKDPVEHSDWRSLNEYWQNLKHALNQIQNAKNGIRTPHSRVQFQDLEAPISWSGAIFSGNNNPVKNQAMRLKREHKGPLVEFIQLNELPSFFKLSIGNWRKEPQTGEGVVLSQIKVIARLMGIKPVQILDLLGNAGIIDFNEKQKLLNSLMRLNPVYPKSEVLLGGFAILKGIQEELPGLGVPVGVDWKEEAWIGASKEMMELEARDRTEQAEHKDESKMYFISNAGLVILNPFILNFCRKLDLLKGLDFVDESSQWQAILALNNFSENEEKAVLIPDLVLPKLMTGFPLHLNFEESLQHFNNYKEERENLYKAICGHWSALSNTSFATFINTFILREGVLKETPNHWILNVEKNSFDVLLKMAPWDFSLIKFPWMEKAIKVNWI